MTLAGGMVCEDGVLVYADTEWTASTLKIQRAKHWALAGSKAIQCVIAGAGDEDHLRLAIQEFWAGILQLDENTVTIAQVMQVLHQALHHVYTTHIYPDPNGAGKDFGMIVGISSPKESPTLLKTIGTGIVISDSYEYVYIGSGMEMAMYLSSRLDVRGISTAVGELMSAFVLWEVKRHVQTCGGDTVIYKLNQQGMKYRGEGDIRDFEDHFASIDRKIQRIRVQTADLDQTDKEFDEKLAKFCDDLRAFRKIRLEKLKGEGDLTS